jgi:hypothetical protein
MLPNAHAKLPGAGARVAKGSSLYLIPMLLPFLSDRGR